MSLSIFEYLKKLGFSGVEERPESKVTQLVKHFAEIPESKIPDNVIEMLKEDGVSCLAVVYKKQVEFFTRTGRMMTSTNQLKNNMYMQVQEIPDGVYAGEMCTFADASLEELGGTISPNRVNPLDEKQTHIANLLHLRVFDYVTIPQYIAGFTTGFNRRARIKFIKENLGFSQYLNRIEPKWCTKENIEAAADVYINANCEGAVFSHPDAEWIAGHKGFHQFKIVRGIHVDLVCTGIEIGKVGKYKGLIAKLKFEYKGLPFSAGLGKGWDKPRQHKETESYLCNSRSIVGQLWHVYGLQESSKGVIRLPKVAEKRIDKTISD